ncbi:hypothetical protein BGW38_010657 [Lunasporangiospora selenospora]|uniref:Cytochrome b5 heme-binding domain-containing protein n=1 Tax=Lunasporangiospora selenospora TaxID=979761 RepID=A0A9P6FXF0_9FUNG|nr:hypothetical protein BGW38_010657 [Lunasporangiospora selenospora]
MDGRQQPTKRSTKKQRQPEDPIVTANPHRRTHASHEKHASSSSSKKQSLIQGLLLSILFFFLSSYIVTDTWLWGYNGKYKNWRRWVPRKQLVFTQQELAQYDGTDVKKPIYLAIRGEVFDVTQGRPYYSRGGNYGFFSGRDASRAYTTGCFQTHLTHDLRGLSPAQIADVDGWADFYRNHPKYYKVGTVILEPIDPLSPHPEDCNKPIAQKPASQ